MTSIPAYLHTAVMSKQIEDCQRLATAGGVAITNAKNCQSNKSKIILYTGKFQLAYHTWISQIPTNKIYINIKAYFLSNIKFRTNWTRQHILLEGVIYISCGFVSFSLFWSASLSLEDSSKTISSINRLFITVVLAVVHS